MKCKNMLLLLFLFFLSACQVSSHYKPEGLRKLSETEILERARARNLTTEKTVFKDSIGNVVALEDLQKMKEGEVYGAYYVNANNEIVEVVIRKATAEDKAFFKKVKAAFEEEEPITIMDVDCASIPQLLEAVYDADQQNRQGQSVENTNADRHNQQIVVSVIEKCGFPTAEAHGYKSVEAAFLVLQHAGKSLREQYFPLIKMSAERGDLQASLVALMEDRMLMDRGEPQKYGSQLIKLNGSETWSLHPIQDPENVNKRRAEVGLGPIEDYLKHFGIDYKAGK